MWLGDSVEAEYSVTSSVEAECLVTWLGESVEAKCSEKPQSSLRDTVDCSSLMVDIGLGGLKSPSSCIPVLT